MSRRAVSLSALDCNKRGQWLQMTFIIVFMLVIAIVMLVVTKFTSDINDMVQLEPDMANESKQASSAHSAATPFVFDSAIPIVLVLLWLLCLGLAYNSGSTPIYMVIALFLIVALGFVGMIFSNTWDEVAGDTDFSSTRDNMPMTSWILDYYLVTVLCIGFSTLWVGISRGGGF